MSVPIVLPASMPSRQTYDDLSFSLIRAQCQACTDKPIHISTSLCGLY